ncbi:MAG: hypothetical protein RR410_06285 [Alistipes sp.]
MISYKKIILLLAFVATVAEVSAQQLVVGLDFDTRFDNREYSGMGYETSETLFSARLTPQVGLRWDARNALMIGVDLLQNFGDESKFLTEAKPLMWYQYESPKVTAVAGIFSRTKLSGDYGEAFFDRSFLFYHNRIQGVMGQYHTENGFVEMAIDWEGMQSSTCREKFRILSAGQYNGAYLYGGYALSVLHFAKTSAPVEGEGVVDNILINPYVGVRFSAFFDFDIRLGYLQSFQRDRYISDSRTPKGGVLDIRMSRWGLSLGNMLYVGQNGMPFYDSYGAALYANSVGFGTRKNIYNRTDISYGRHFFNNTLGVKAGMFFHYDGVSVGTQQLLEVSVRLQKIFTKKK